MKITIKCKLSPTIKQSKILDRTLKKCLDASNYISKIAWQNRCFNRVALHHLTYYKVRKRFKLTSQICCAIKDKVVFSYRANKKKEHIFKKATLPLNFTRTLRLIGLEAASISTISGREKIKLQLGNYQRANLSRAGELLLPYGRSFLIQRLPIGNLQRREFGQSLPYCSLKYI